MFTKNTDLKLPRITRAQVPYLLLLSAGILEFLFMVLESRCSGIAYFLTETCLIIPSLLFAGYMLRDLTAFSLRRLLLSSAYLVWFLIVQLHQKSAGLETFPLATIVFVYLMAFPFAALTDDRKNYGIRLIGSIMLTASLVIVGYCLLLMLNLVPAGWKDVLYWDGARLHALWHSNVTACFFMVGIGIAAAFLVQAKKRISKVLLAAAMAIQFAAMAMTNCRTTILMTGALLGGIVFFQLCRKGGWKRLLLGLMAAAVILAGSFKLAGKIYQWNNDRIAAGIQQMIASGDKQKLKDYQFYVTKDGQVVMNSNNQQKSLSQDMRTLNGRTSIWAAANQVLQDDEEIKHWGTPYVSTILSAYNWFPVEHSHNSWVETVMRTGVTGLVLALFYTALSIWYAARLLLSRDAELWKQILAMTTMCLLVTGFLEPYLFITDIYYHVTNFLFFFLTGYLDHWCSLLPRRKK